MPELPEVESVARSLRPLVHGQKIRAIHVLHPIVLGKRPLRELTHLAEGRTIKDVLRVGKYLFLELDSGALIEMHFRFDGQLIWFKSAKDFLARANADKAANGVHVDAAFELPRGVLAFADGRHLGRIRGWESREKSTTLKQLGVDALSPKFTSAFLRDALSKSKRSIKQFLLDQGKIAGVGNIYSCESLWHARIDPRRAANSLQRNEPVTLHKAIVSVLRRALECCLKPAPKFEDADWWFQGIEKILRVYQREGQKCRRDGHLILRIEQDGRSTYFCGHCQK